MDYVSLKERSRETYARKLSQEHSLEELLRATESAAYKNGDSATKRVLKMLRSGGEAWVKAALEKLSDPEVRQPSIEDCLMMKTRLGLTKNKYRGISSFVKRGMGQKLAPWKDVMTFRNDIIPRFAEPNENAGYLSVKISIRDLITNDIERIMELDDVRSKLASTSTEGVLDCLMHVSAGPDSATGFSHYNQAKFLARDDSLFNKHLMSMRLESRDTVLYSVPNPQSDTFRRERSMCWTKETDVLTREMFVRFFEEIDEINDKPVVVQIENVTLRVKAEAIYSMIDGKAANAIVGNGNTHACPLCPSYFGIEKRIGLSFFHARLNAVEWIMRNAAKKAVPGNPAQSHPDVKKASSRQMHSKHIIK